MASGALADDIRRRLGELSPAERKVARVLLAAYPSAGFETVAVLADRAAVSAPTVLRFVNRLGYRGFPDFQAALRHELDERNASPLTLYPDGQDPDTTTGGLLARAADVLTGALARTLAEVPEHDLDRAAALLSDPKRRIALVGGRFTHVFAQYLALHLVQLRDDVRLLPDSPVERAARVASFTRRDVLVVFDYRRYEPDKTVLAETTAARGGATILFTDTFLSPVAAHADVVLGNQVGSTSPYDSLVPTLATVETVVTAVLTTLGEAAHTRMARVETVAKDLGLY